MQIRTEKVVGRNGQADEEESQPEPEEAEPEGLLVLEVTVENCDIIEEPAGILTVGVVDNKVALFNARVEMMDILAVEILRHFSKFFFNRKLCLKFSLHFDHFFLW